MLTAYVAQHIITALAYYIAKIVGVKVRTPAIPTKAEMRISTIVCDALADGLAKLAAQRLIGGKRLFVYNNFPPDTAAFRAFAADAFEGGEVFGCV